MASARWLVEISLSPAKSAMVRATLIDLKYDLAVRPSLTVAWVRKSSCLGWRGQNFLISWVVMSAFDVSVEPVNLLVCC